MSDTATGYKGELFTGTLGTAASRANAGKRIVHTMHPDFITGIGRVSAFGAKKYHMRNFLMSPGMAWSGVYDSAMGHLQKFWGGEVLDEESGQQHILMAAWNLMVLHLYSNEPAYALGDDRPSSVEFAGKLWTDWKEAFERVPNPPAADTLELGVPDSFEGKLDHALSLLAEIGFRVNELGDIVNEHDETPVEVAKDYNWPSAFTSDNGEQPRTVKSSGAEVPAPAFLQDPIRAFYAAKDRKAEAPALLASFAGKVGWGYTPEKEVVDLMPLNMGDLMALVEMGKVTLTNVRLPDAQASEEGLYALGAFDIPKR